MTTKDRIRLPMTAPEAMQGLAGVEEVLARAGIETGLHHLIQLRASQINGCAFCVAMHSRDARRDGESDERLDHLVVWRDVDLFTAAERAALAWTEALTELDRRSDLDALLADLVPHFDEAEIAALTVAVGMINVWNRLNIAAHGFLSRRQQLREAA